MCQPKTRLPEFDCKRNNSTQGSPVFLILLTLAEIGGVLWGRIILGQEALDRKEQSMSDLVVVAFDNETKAYEVRDKLISLQKDHIVVLEDAAIAIRRMDGKVKIDQAVGLVGRGTLGGAFWGFLFGIIFLVPFLGAAIGAATGALAGKFTDLGVDDNFIKEVGGTIEPGNSALLLLIREATWDKLEAEIEPFKGKILKTSLSNEQEEKLKEAFATEEQS